MSAQDPPKAPEAVKEPTPDSSEESKAGAPVGQLEVPASSKGSKGHSRKPSNASSTKEDRKDKEKGEKSNGNSSKQSGKDDSDSGAAKNGSKKEKAAKQDEESEESESSEEDPRVETNYFDMSHAGRFWNRIEAGLRDGASLSCGFFLSVIMAAPYVGETLFKFNFCRFCTTSPNIAVV